MSVWEDVRDIALPVMLAVVLVDAMDVLLVVVMVAQKAWRKVVVKVDRLVA